MTEHKPRDPEPIPDPNGWMLSFSDTLTNLLCFFVLLLTMSSMDSKALKETFGFFDAAVGALGKADLVKASKSVMNSRPIVTNQLAKDVVEAMKRKIAGGMKALDAAAEALAEYTTRPEFRVVAMTDNYMEIDIAHSELFSESGQLMPSGEDLLTALAQISAGANLKLRLTAWQQAPKGLQPLIKTGPDSWDKALDYAGKMAMFLGKRKNFLPRLILSGRGDGQSRSDSIASAASRVTAIFEIIGKDKQ